MSDKSTIDKKLSFTLKDMIYIIAIIISVLGNYYSTDTRLIFVEKDLTEIKAENKAYKGLPTKVQNIEKQVNENAKIIEAIYLGLVAKGIIKPNTNIR